MEKTQCLQHNEQECFKPVSILDLSMAFDLVNVELLVKRLTIMGMLNDLIGLIQKFSLETFVLKKKPRRDFHWLGEWV